MNWNFSIYKASPLLKLLSCDGRVKQFTHAQLNSWPPTKLKLRKKICKKLESLRKLHEKLVTVLKYEKDAHSGYVEMFADIS